MPPRRCLPVALGFSLGKRGCPPLLITDWRGILLVLRHPTRRDLVTGWPTNEARRVPLHHSDYYLYGSPANHVWLHHRVCETERLLTFAGALIRQSL